MRVTVFIAVSVDGFIAREDGSVDWLPSEGSEQNEDYGFQTFFDSVDALVMGRKTYEEVSSFESWTFGKKPVFVLSTHDIKIPHPLIGTVSQVNGTPSGIMRQLANKGYQHIYVDGGNTIQGFLREGLVNALILTRIPILLGSGIPLFGKLPDDVHLQHVQTRQYKSGFVQSEYEVIHKSSA